MNYSELGEKVKSKYPEYKDMDSAVLGQKTAEKYPEYKSMLSSETTTETKSEIKPDAKGALQSYLQDAQPAFKWAIGGMPKDLESLNEVSQGSWTDLYRRANLPGSNSSSTAMQMIPQVAGVALDAATRPSSYIGGAIAKYGGAALANNPMTRRALQEHLPTLSKELIAANPMAPIYKQINGMQVDITKPIPKSPAKLVKQGKKLVSMIDETISNARNEYKNLLKPFYDTGIPDQELSSIPQSILDDLGLKASKKFNPTTLTDDTQPVTVKQLWEGRWNLLKKLNESSFGKEELLKKTNLTEDKLMNAVQQIKAIVMNNTDDTTRKAIDILDPKFTEIISSGKGITRAIYNPTTKKINTKTLTNIFKDKNDEGSRELFTRFSFFDKRINEVVSSVKGYNRNQALKKWGLGAVGLGAADQMLRWRLRNLAGQNQTSSG